MPKQPTPRGRKKSNPAGGGSPLDEQKKALAAEEARLRTEMEEREKLIKEAPRIAAAQARRRREELVRRASRTEARFGAPCALVDPRHPFEASTGALPRGRKLRKHRNQGMWLFLVLCAVFAGVLVLVYYTVILPG